MEPESYRSVMQPTLIVLAAGMGSRYGGLKQLDGIGPSGETIMDYTIYDAIRAGFGKVVFVIRRDMEQDFNQKVLKKISPRISTEIVFQKLDDLPDGLRPPQDRMKPWGTAHAVWACRNTVESPFAMVNADDFYGRNSLITIQQYLADLDSGQMAACMVGYQLENTLSDYGSVSRGICKTDDEGHLLSIKERRRISKEDGKIIYTENGSHHYLSGRETASMNLIGFSPEVFDVIEKGLISFFKKYGPKADAEYFIPDVLKELIAMGIKIPVLPTSSKWFGVTYQEDKAVVQDALTKLHRRGIYPARLYD